MFARLASVWERVRNSLWALPLAIALLCAGLAVLALRIDLPWISEIGWLYSGSSQQAPEFASSLVGATITLMSLAFSITMVVLALAAQQLGPRLIEIFMRDRTTQAALGLFLGTVVYLMLVLRALDGSEAGRSPALAITGGTVLVLASVITLLFFVHSLARSIVSDSIIARVGQILEDEIVRAFPAETPAENSCEPPIGGAPVRLRARGYVQRIDYPSLVRAARKHNAAIRLAYNAGSHVVDGEVDAWVVSTSDLSDSISSAVIFGGRRSPGHDPEWSGRQLVEIALRALSPGVNDVFTALAVIDRMASAVALLLQRGQAPCVWVDEDGVPRVFGPAPTFEVMLGAAFDQIREAGAGQGAVLHRLAGNLLKLARLCEGRHADAIRRQLDLLDAAARRLTDDAHRPEIEAATRAGRDALIAGAGHLAERHAPAMARAGLVS
jgi:uncharacterized membrane protein